MGGALQLIIETEPLPTRRCDGATGRSWTYILTFVGVLTVAIYGILNLEYPRLGLIHLDEFDQVLVDLRESMR
jgi:hypothetical protein